MEFSTRMQFGWVESRNGLESLFDSDDNLTTLERGANNSRKNRLILVFDKMQKSEKNRTRGCEDWLARIAEAGLAGDRRHLELVVVGAIRSLKPSAPELGKRLGTILADYSANSGALRWKEMGPPPTDAEEGLSLVKNHEVGEAERPILCPEIDRRIEQFLRERGESARLLNEGYLPPSSLLLTGAPGTGKSMLAKWIARELKLPLVVQDLATSISSLLGKTGFNLRRTLDYARGRPCVLLLDEFDALAKRRDDGMELGELKRIVNVLLKELEDWPLPSVLVAATNHPELLDAAVRRRFHLVVDLPLPGLRERIEILQRAGGRFVEQLSGKLLDACATALDGCSASDLTSLIQAAVRNHLTADVPMAQAMLGEVQIRWAGRMDRQAIGPLVRALKQSSRSGVTVRDLAMLFGKSVSTIQHHLRHEVSDG